MKMIEKCMFHAICMFLLSAIFMGCASTPKENGDIEIKNIRMSEFILGAGDTIEISVYRNDDLKKSVKIDKSGKIMFPLIGDVEAGGKSIFALRDDIQNRLAKYIINPEVTINVSTVQSQKVMVLGEVYNPGVLSLESDLSVIEAITKAGGMTHDAKLANVLLISRNNGKQEVSSLDLKKAFKGGDISNDRMLQNGDIVYLPAVRIANVSWYFSHLSKILNPIVSLESGIVLWPQVKDVLQGDTGDDGPTIVTTPD